MLEITIEETEFYDPNTNKFIQIPPCNFTLEHSLISLAKWESRWEKPYLTNVPKTPEQDLDYIRCMIIGPIKDEKVLKALSVSERMRIQQYIDAPMTATTFSQKSRPRSTNKDVMTAEVIYSRMFGHGISMECQKWHLNRLLALIKVCDIQNSPKEKMSKKQTAMWNAEQNAARRAKYNTRG